ncbi:MAG TPA: hypothetical protein VGM36_00945 [Rhizomicrobium sp.]
MTPNVRESQEMLARVSRSEAETQLAYRKIEDHLRSLARRLDSTERAQFDNSRVLNEAAGEINVASREQTQAFDTLGAHVIGLGERIDRLEQKVGADSSKDSVRGLQDGLARMADQVSETANQSASQISVLASAMEAVVGKMGSAHEQAAASATLFGQRIGHIDDRIHAIETTLHVKGEATDRALLRLEQRGETENDLAEQLLAGIEERHAAIRNEFRQNIQSLDGRYGAWREELQRGLDRTRDAREQAHNEVHARIAELESQFAAAHEDTSADDRLIEQLQRVEETVQGLTARVAAHELQSAGTMTRLEEGFARIEGQQDNSLNRRVYGVERSIQDLMDRLEAAERHSIATSTSIEEQLRGLGGKIEGFDRNTREAISELHHSVKDASARLEVIEGVPPSPAPLEVEDIAQPQVEVAPAEDETFELAAEEENAPRELPAFDMPPFDEPTPEPVKPAFQDSAIHRAFGSRPHEDFVSATAQDEDLFREERPLAAHGFGDGHSGEDDFLSIARRSATAAAAMSDEPVTATTLGGFTWGARRDEPEAKDEQPRSRTVLIGGIALVAILAIGAGVMMSQRLGAHKILQAPLPAPVVAKHVETTPPVLHHEPKPNALVLPKAETPAPLKQAVVTPKMPAPVAGGDRLTTLASGGNAKAQLLVGLKYLDGDGVAVDEAIAAKWLQRAADQGEPIAQYRLGTLFERGHGVATDAAKAVHWYEAAARQGNRKAMHNLAVAYAEGTGTPKNFTEAARWFGKAATLGLADSQFNLAVLYERGLGVPQSLTEAYKWYAIAATQGDNESKARVVALTTQLSASDHDGAQKAADTFRPEPLNRAANVPPETPGHG